MSRIGKSPIPVPEGVQVSLGAAEVRVTGPKGELSRRLGLPHIQVRQEDGQIMVTRDSEQREARAYHGLARTLIANMVEGVTSGFRKTLEIQGVGYRAAKAGDRITLQVGFSHPVEVEPPPGITFELETPTRLHVVGINKEVVGETAARIRRVRPPEPYKGKGIRYAGEQVRRKPGKAGRVAAR